MEVKNFNEFFEELNEIVDKFPNYEKEETVDLEKENQELKSKIEQYKEATTKARDFLLSICKTCYAVDEVPKSDDCFICEYAKVINLLEGIKDAK